MAKTKPVIDPTAAEKWRLRIRAELLRVVENPDEIDQRDADDLSRIFSRFSGITRDWPTLQKIASWLFGEGFPANGFERKNGKKFSEPNNDLLGKLRVVLRNLTEDPDR